MKSYAPLPRRTLWFLGVLSLVFDASVSSVFANHFGLGPGGGRLTTPSSPSGGSSTGSGSGAGGGTCVKIQCWDGSYVPCDRSCPMPSSGPSGGAGSGRTRGAGPTNATRATEINNQGVDLTAQGDYEGALIKYLEAAALNPQDPVIQRNVRKGRANVAFQQAIAASKRRDHELTVAKVREAVRHWPDNDAFGEHLRRNLREAEEDLEEAGRVGALERRLAEEQQQRERLEAETAARLRASLDRLAQALAAPNATPGFDGGQTSDRPAGGLDFLRDAAAPRPAASGPTVDSSVVDLRDARTHTVDPTRVKGEPPLAFMTAMQPAAAAPSPAGSAPAEKGHGARAGAEAERQRLADDLLNAILRGDDGARRAALIKLMQAAQTEVLDEIRRGEEVHRGTMADIRMLLANGPRHAEALQHVREQVRQQELAALRAAETEWHAEGTRYIEWVARQPRGTVSVADVLAATDDINSRLRRAEAAALREASEALTREVQRLKETLLAETGGRPIVPPAPEHLKLLFP